METKTVGTLHRIFTPPVVAALASFIPVLLAAAWKGVSPGYNCNISNAQSVWDSPCFAVSAGLAYGLGWVVGLITTRAGSRPAQGEDAAGRLERLRNVGTLVAGLVGLGVGILPAGYVLNPCP